MIVNVFPFLRALDEARAAQDRIKIDAAQAAHDLQRLRERVPSPKPVLDWPAIDPTLLDKKPTSPTPAEQAAERLGYEPFNYCERS